MSAVPHSLPDDLQPARSTRPLAPRWRACARECGWLLLTAAAATVALAVFVLATEQHVGGPLFERMLQPINLLRLSVMTGCLALWSYILRSARAPVDGASAPTRSPGTRAAGTAGRG